ncbi:MAG: hypothetical protein HRS57_02090 [Mycoplasmataceae bacterium]|nr:hypothetical protein [Mycoplasmataceae bacterium]
MITDKYVAKTPEGNYINLSYSNKVLDTEWDVSEVSNIDINHIYCNERATKLNWINEI